MKTRSGLDAFDDDDPSLQGAGAGNPQVGFAGKCGEVLRVVAPQNEGCTERACRTHCPVIVDTREETSRVWVVGATQCEVKLVKCHVW